MAIGDTALLSGFSYLGVGRETTFGTGVTATANLDFLSASLRTVKESKILEQVERYRTYSRNIYLGKKIEGEVEFYYAPRLDVCNYILQNAFGGTITVATVTGETVGGGGLDHTFNTGNMDQAYKSLTINMRKGPSTGGKVFEYVGCRVNELTFAAELDEPLMCTVGIIARDSTQTTNDIEGSLTVQSNPLLTFDNGRVSVETTFASLTATSFWHVQSFELTINNNLKADNESRRIGTDILTVLPPGMQTYTLNMSMRFDTTTAFSAMINASTLSAELVFLGPTISGSVARQGIKLQIPRLFISDSGDPEIGGPDEVLTANVVCHLLRDVSSSTGFALRAIVTNSTANYAS